MVALQVTLLHPSGELQVQFTVFHPVGNVGSVQSTVHTLQNVSAQKVVSVCGYDVFAVPQVASVFGAGAVLLVVHPVIIVSTA